MDDTANILFIGDIIGRPGRLAVKGLVPGLIAKYSPDVVIANGENAAGGFGITADVYEEIRGLKIDIITSGNHIWDKKEIIDRMGEYSHSLIRPANYPAGAPGAGYTVFKSPSGKKIAVLNLSGRVFMDSLDCPFRTGMEAARLLREETPVIVVDMHAEATSEKAAMAWHLNGMASAVIGTHTHVQTSDERILSGGTAFITDAGMTGPTESVIGMNKEAVLHGFLAKMPQRFEVGSKGVELQGVFVSVGTKDGRAKTIERIKLKL
ncbi:MAG: TIGR00282 family metallophosphoesterase [Deltaproteobacteria bacterium]|nr:TIGR00282 family metallophosphoesterase [Deltaproteobacteria bacterium]